MNFVYFDPRDRLLKSHFGAIKAGENQRFRLRLPKDCGVWYCYLLLKADKDGFVSSHEMTFEFQNGGALYYKTDVKFSEGLYWYAFQYTTEHDKYMITKTDDFCGSVSPDGRYWQQTVYSADYKTPEWLRGGLIYQIFPDRFFVGGRDRPNLPEGRCFRTDWGGTPEYRQPKGEIRTLGNDFFGGNFEGIMEKLPYLKDLGVTCLYLNPIFFASSNHRYNTADYEKIDPLLGTEGDFCTLCKKAHENGIRVILDGVFSHTGDDSKYFDRFHKYGGGAASDPDSPYRSWYKFVHWPDRYHSWWGIETLPEVEEDDPGFLDYICGRNGILRRWIRLGADGWRLDVADELPDIFLDRLRAAVKDENPNAVILGEVWEDASNKISYGSRRRYLLGNQLDTVMNYPVANAILDFVKNGNAQNLVFTVQKIIENYPKESLHILMNHIGTHDTARAITALGFSEFPKTRAEQAGVSLSGDALKNAKELLKLAAVLQYTLPGVPSLYYGDEAGMQGFGDPFCRGCYPWGHEDEELLEFYKKLGAIRKETVLFQTGDFVPILFTGDLLIFERRQKDDRLLVAVNRSLKTIKVPLPQSLINYESLFDSERADRLLTLRPCGFALYRRTAPTAEEPFYE